MNSNISKITNAYNKVLFYENFNNLNINAKDNIIAKRQYEDFCNSGIELQSNGEIYLKENLLNKILPKNFNYYFQGKYGVSEGYDQSETKPIKFRIDCRLGWPDDLSNHEWTNIANEVRSSITTNYGNILKYNNFYKKFKFEYFITFTMTHIPAVRYMKSFLIDQAQMTLF